jgi:hypothetical protein
VTSDDPDEWWATLSSSRKASIRRWLTGEKPPPTPEELGLVPILDEQGQVLEEALPG